MTDSTEDEYKDWPIPPRTDHIMVNGQPWVINTGGMSPEGLQACIDAQNTSKTQARTADANGPLYITLGFVFGIAFGFAVGILS